MKNHLAVAMLSLALIFSLASCDILGMVGVPDSSSTTSTTTSTTVSYPVPEAIMVEAGIYRDIYNPNIELSLSGNTFLRTQYSSTDTITFSANEGKFHIFESSDEQIMDGGFVANMEYSDGINAETFIVAAAKRISGTPGTKLGTFRAEIWYKSDPSAVEYYEVKIEPTVIQFRLGLGGLQEWITLVGKAATDFERFFFTFDGTDYLAIASYITTASSFMPEIASRTIPNMRIFAFPLFSGEIEMGSISGNTYQVSSEGIWITDYGAIYNSSGTYSLSGDRIRFTEPSGSYIDLLGGFYLQHGQTYVIPIALTIPGFVYQATKKSDGLTSIFGTYSSTIKVSTGGPERLIKQEFVLRQDSTSSSRYTTDVSGTTWSEWSDWEPEGRFFKFEGTTYIALKMGNNGRMYSSLGD